MQNIRELLTKPAINKFAQLPSFSSGVYIYGAGELGLLAIEYCESCQIPIAGIIDKNKTGVVKGKGSEYAIGKPNEASIMDRHIPVAVAVATVPYVPIAESLEAMGWRTVVPFYGLTSEKRTGHPLSNGWMIGEVSEQERATVSWICENWADTMSFSHYEAFLAWHIDGSELPLINYPIDPDQRYTIEPLLDFFSVRHHQFVDIGSHCGGTVQRLNEKGIFFNNYILIEPDAVSRNALSTVAAQLRKQGREVNILSDIVGESRSTLPFQEGLGYCSQIWSQSSTYKEVLPIDDLTLGPDFLKIHTEGSEWDILNGAQNTIQRYRPALAFSVYHRRDGFCADIAKAMKLFAGYRWYFRLHSYQGTGAFVYAIPGCSTFRSKTPSCQTN